VEPVQPVLYPDVLEDLAKPIYHRYHVAQVRVMHQLTGEAKFAQMSVRWASFDRLAHVMCAVMQEAPFALGDGRRRRRWLAEH
jgi:hypothetical protein